MPDALEEAALSGALFKDNYRPPERSGTPEPNSDSDSNIDSEDDITLNQVGESTTALIEEDEIHAKGAQTGIKGVLNDKKQHTRSTVSAAKREKEELKGRMEKMSIVGNTWEEEEVLREKEKEQDEGDGLEGWRKGRIEEMRARKGLKEVGKEGFVSAVEREGWVVVLIYEPVSVSLYRGPNGHGSWIVVSINADCIGDSKMSDYTTRNDYSLYNPLLIKAPNNIIKSPSNNTSFLPAALHKASLGPQKRL